jgi:hypothetical protein
MCLGQYLLRESEVGNEKREREREMRDAGRWKTWHSTSSNQARTIVRTLEMTRHPVSASAFAGKLQASVCAH